GVHQMMGPRHANRGSGTTQFDPSSAQSAIAPGSVDVAWLAEATAERMTTLGQASVLSVALSQCLPQLRYAKIVLVGFLRFKKIAASWKPSTAPRQAAGLVRKCGRELEDGRGGPSNWATHNQRSRSQLPCIGRPGQVGHRFGAFGRILSGDFQRGLPENQVE